MPKDVVSITRNTRYRRSAGAILNDGGPDGRLLTGVDLRMTNGSLWFHPDNGGAPILVEKSDDHEEKVHPGA